ncbi:Negative regulator of mitotic exit [Xanthoria calcicola]
MSFLFGKKSKQPPASLPPATRDVHTSGGSRGPSGQQQPNGVNLKGQTPTPERSVNNSIGGANTPSPEHGPDQRGALDQESQHGARPPLTGPSPPVSANNASPYPWSQRRLNFTSSQPNPFPRYGAAVNAVSSKEGDLYLMGGLVNGSTVKGDLWMIEAGAVALGCYPVGTTFEGPGPRVGHASLLVGNAFIVFGGDTKVDDRDKLDDTLYLLNTSTRHWSRSMPPGPRPAGRYGHTLNILGSRIYVFGGQVEGYFFNDLVAFDLNALQNANSRWDMLIPNSADGGPPEGQIPPARTNHTIVSWNDKLYLFGGTNGTQWFNDVWSYDPRQVAWTQLDCIGYIPAPREGHSAALVNDVMYIFGGRTEDGTDLGDLAAFKITSRRWFTFQNMGPAPSPRSGHSMTAFGKQIVVLAGEPSSAPRNIDELSMVYVLDTGKIRYPNDQQIQQTPTGERVPGNRRPSTERPAGGPSAIRGAIPQNPAGGPSEGLRRVFSGSRESMVGPGAGPPTQSGPPPTMGLPPGIAPGGGPANRVHDLSTMSGPTASGSTGSASRSPYPPLGQAPSGPPPQQQAPPPRPNGVIPQMVGQGPRSKTPTKDQRGYGPPMDTGRNGSFDREPTSPIVDSSPQSDGLRSQSPMVNGRRTPTQQTLPNQQGMRGMPNGADLEEERMVDAEPMRSRSRQAEQQREIRRMENSEEYPPNNMPPQQPLQNQRSFNRDYESSNGMPRPSLEANKERSPVSTQQVQQLEDLKMQHEGLSKQLDVIRSQNAWYASELALAKKAGYQQNSSQFPLDERAFNDQEQPLIEALIAMRAQLAEVQQSVDSRVNAAGEQVALVEHQRDVAVREAAYAKAKLAAHGGSHVGTPSSEAMSKDLDAEDRSNDLGRKLAAALATQNELRATLSSMTAAIETERHAREHAEAAAETAKARVREVHEIYHPGELESLRTELHQLAVARRDEAVQRVEAHARAGTLESDKEDLSRRLNEALENTQQHTMIFGSLREAVSASNDKAAHLERKLDEERGQRELIDQKLLQLRSEHEERTAELESTTRKLRDAEELAETHANESRKHREVILGGLDKIGTRDLGASTSAAVDERVTLLQQQIEDSHELVRKNQSDADIATEKLRRAEERIAVLEAHQEQSSREALTVRNQLQEAIQESQNHQTRHSEAERTLEGHQRDASALLIQHNVLKELLAERPEKPRSRPSTPEQNRMHDLEEQLENSLQSQTDMKADYEAREQEADKMYREKLEELRHDYQAAVGYVKGAEKMLKHMKEELSKYKVELNKHRKQNQRLQEELDGAQQARSIEPEAAAEWEQERQSLRRELDEMQASVKDSVGHLERQMEEMQQELYNAQEERDHYRQGNQQFQQQLTQTIQQAHRDLEQLKSENSMLESRALDAENKVTLLLDQVGNSVTNYRRQSQQMNGHHRNMSTNSTATMGPPEPVTANNGGAPQRPMHSQSNSVTTDATFAGGSNRNSMALDHLASELENLRTHWEGTHRNYRLSSQFDFERTPTSASTTGGPGMSESLANWRKRLEEEDEERERGHVSHSPQGNPGPGGLDFGGGKTAGVGATTVDPRVGGRPMMREEEDKYKI